MLITGACFSSRHSLCVPFCIETKSSLKLAFKRKSTIQWLIAACASGSPFLWRTCIPCWIKHDRAVRVSRHFNVRDYYLQWYWKTWKRKWHFIQIVKRILFVILSRSENRRQSGRLWQLKALPTFDYGRKKQQSCYSLTLHIFDFDRIDRIRYIDKHGLHAGQLV